MSEVRYIANLEAGSQKLTRTNFGPLLCDAMVKSQRIAPSQWLNHSIVVTTEDRCVRMNDVLLQEHEPIAEISLAGTRVSSFVFESAYDTLTAQVGDLNQYHVMFLVTHPRVGESYGPA